MSIKRIDMIVEEDSTKTTEEVIDTAFDLANEKDDYEYFVDVTDSRNGKKYMVFGTDAQDALGVSKVTDLIVPEEDFITEFESIEGLLTADTNAITVVVKRYRTDSSFIDTEYYYNKDLDKTLHNGGTFIDPLRTFPDDWTDSTKVNDWYKEVSSDDKGLWVLKTHSETIDVLWFGAFADGSNGDDICINRAIQSARNDYSNSSIIYLPHGTYLLKDSIKLYQTVQLKGDSFASTSGHGTELLCDFDSYDAPDDIYTDHYDIVLDKKPMLYNIWLINHASITDIRLNGNDKDVYGMYFTELYYTNFKRITITNTANAASTVVYGQFNHFEDISCIFSGTFRFISCSTTSVDGLDIEGCKTNGNSLEIVHDISVKASMFIDRFHYEEPDGGSYQAGSLMLISQRGVHINGLYGNFSGTDEDRYFDVSPSISYTFDGVTYDTVTASHCTFNSTSTSSGKLDVKLGSGTSYNQITGTHTYIIEEGALSSNQVSTTDYMNSFKVLNSDGTKNIWFEDDNILNIGDNSNRKLKTDGADLSLENTYGAVNILSGTETDRINIKGDTVITDKDDNIIIKLMKEGVIIIENLPSEEPDTVNQIWNDNGTLKIKI